MAIKISGSTIIDDSRRLLNVGLSTFSGNIDANGNLDVDGDTELDNLNVSGISTFQSHVHLGDDDILKIGDSDDLQIYHNGSTSYIDESGTGNLHIRSNQTRIQKYTGEQCAKFIADGAVELYYDNVKKLETKSDGIDVTGEVQCDSLDVDGAASFNGGNVSFNDDDVDFMGAASNASWDYSDSKFRLNDNTKISFGNGLDLEIYHDASNSYIDETGAGSLILRASPSIEFRKAGSTEKMLYAEPDAQVELYYDNVKKFETTIGGATVTGILTATTFSGSGASLTNLPASTTITVADESSDTTCFPLFVTAATGDLAPKSGSNLTFNSSTGALTATSLISNDTLTVSGISNLNNDVIFDGASYNASWDKSANTFNFADNAKATFGDGGDLEIYHDASHSYIKDTGTGNLIIYASGFNVANAAGNENMISAANDGAVELYYDNSKKLETKSDGVDITGELQSDTLDVDGAANIQGVLTMQSYIQGTGPLDLYGSSSSSVGLSLDTDGNITIPDKIIHAGDTNTAIRFPAADTFTVETAGSERIRIDSTGKSTAISTHSNGAVNDGIRITTRGTYSSSNSTNSGPAISFGQFHNTYPTWKTAQIAGIRRGANWHGALAFYTNDGSSETDLSEKLRILSDGDVGIGLTNPSEKLHTIGDVMIQGTGGVGEQTLFIGKSATVIPSTRGVAVAAAQNSSADHDMVLKTSTGSSGLVEQVRIKDDGKVGIGSTQPTKELDVQGNVVFGANATRLTTYSDSTYSGIFNGSSLTSNESFYMGGGTLFFYANAAERLRIDSSGRALFGGNGSSRTIGGVQGSLQLEGTTFSNSSMSLMNNANDVNPSFLTFGKSKGGALGSNTIVANGDYLGVIKFVGADGTDVASEAARIECRVDGAPGSNDIPGRLSFYTTPDGSASATERVRITNAGHLSIVDDNQKILVGANDDLEIYHDGTDTTIDNNTGDLNIKTTGSGDDIYLDAADDIFIRVQGNESAITCTGNGAVELYHDNSKKLETTGYGATVVGGLQVSGIVTATSFAGDGSALTGIAAGGGSGEFNTGITSTVQATPLSFESTMHTFPSTSGRQYVIESINVANVDESVGVGTTVNIIASIQDATAAEQTYIAYNVPIVTGGVIELLKNPIVAGPSDVIRMWTTNDDYVGVNNAADVYINYAEHESTDFISKFAATTTINSTSTITLYTSTSNPTMIEKIGFANRTDTGDFPVSIKVTSGTTTSYLAKNLIIPRYSTVDILDRPKRIETDAKIEVEVGSTETIDVIIAGKKITS